MKAEEDMKCLGFECLKEQKSSLGRVRPFGEGAGQAAGKGGKKKRGRRKYMFAARRTGGEDGTRPGAAFPNM